jgi:SWI/SNF-related matrix-associated actin-dependent regulator of chromatin subfamily A-like protein 1
MTDRYDLMPFQKCGAEWLANQPGGRGILGDEPGIGKTVQALRAADLVGAKRIWTWGPAIGRVNWRREYDRWSLVVPEFRSESYDMALNPDVRKAFAEFNPDVVILDEAHYLKSRDARRTKTMFGTYCQNTGLLKNIPFVFRLSGTMWMNDITELWTHLRCDYPDLIDFGKGPLGFMEFAARYCDFQIDDYSKLKVLGNKREMLPELRKIIQKVMLRRKAADVVKDMPPLFFGDVEIEADELPRALLELDEHPDIHELRRVVDSALADDSVPLHLDEDAIPLARLRRLVGTVKAPIVADLVAGELSDNAYDKIVLFAWHKDVLDILWAKLKDFGVCVIRGGQTDKVRQAMIDAFQQEKNCRVALVQIAAGYHTITLHAAAHVGMVEQAWTPDINFQAAKRAHRKGQTRAVRVRSFGLANTLDAGLNRVLVRKTRNLAELES